MAKNKSIIEKFTETIKDIATTATDAASYALKDTPALKADERAVAFMPLAADGLVSDPLMVPPVAPVRRRKRTAPKRATKKATKKTVKESARRLKKSSSRRSKTAKRTTQPAKRRSGKTRKAGRPGR